MKQTEQNIHVDDYYINIEFPDELEQKWQEIVDLLANILKVSASVITRVKPPYLEVFKTSATPGNPFKAGDKEKMYRLYCEAVLKSQQELLVPNALKDEYWKANPDIELGLISYLGYPLNFPDQTPFGTICLLDNKENYYDENHKKLLLQFKNTIELDLKIYIDLYKRKSDVNQSLSDVLLELKTLSTAVNQSANVVVVTDARGIIKYVNQKFTEVTGYTKEEAVGQNPRILKSGFYNKTEYKRLWRTIKTGAEWNGEFLNKKKNGELYWEKTSIYPLCDDKAKIVNYVAVKEDVTNFKKDQEGLEQAGEIWKNIPIGMFILQLENADDACFFRIVSANPAMVKIVGMAAEDLIDQKLCFALPGLIGTTVPDKFASVIHDKQPVTIDYFYYSDERISPAYYSIKTFPLQDNRLVVSFEDITEKKEAENLLKQKFNFIAFTNKVSSSLINAPVNQVDLGINAVLRCAVKYANAVRGYVYQAPEDEKILAPSFEWHRKKEVARKDELRSFSKPFYSKVLSKLKGKPYFHTSYDDKEVKISLSSPDILPGLNTGSSIFLGLYSGEQITGVIGFDFNETNNKISQSVLDAFNITANIIANAIERVHNKKKLTESETMFKSIFQTAGIGIALLELDSKVIKVNPMLNKLYSDEGIDLTGKIFFDIVHDDDIKKSREQFGKLVLGKIKKYETERKYVNNKGELVFVKLNVTSIRDRDGTPKYAVLLAEDISHKKKLYDSEIRYKKLHDSLPAGIVLQASDGRIISANKVACAILRLSQDQILEKTSEYPDRKSIHADGSPFIGADHPAMQSLSSGKPMQDVIMGLKYTENTTWININSQPLFRENEPAPYAVLTSFTDITALKQAQEKLTLSEQKLSNHIEETPIGVIELDIDLKVISWNKAVVRIFGYSKEEAIGRNALGLIWSGNGNKEMQLIWKGLLNQSGDKEIIYNNITKEGKTILCNWRHTALADKQGNTIGIVSLVQDTTEKHKIEEQLRKSEERHKLISAITSDFVYSNQCDERGKYTLKWVSGAFTRITGYSIREINEKEKRWKSIVHPEDLKILKQERGGISKLHISKTKEYRIITKNGSIKWLSDSYVQLLGAKDIKDHVIHGSIRDITDRKQAELALLESEERLSRLSEVAKEGIYIHDNYRIVEVNKALTKISGYSRSELLSMDSRSLSSKASIPTIMDHIQKFKNVPYMIEGIRKDGSTYAMETQGKPYIFKGKNMRVVIVRNVSEMIKAEQALIESEEKFFKIFDLNPGIVVIIEEKEQTIVEVNQGIIEILGYTREELIGKTAIELGLWADTDANKWEIFYEEYNKNIGFARMVTYFRKKNRQIIICDISAKRIEINGRNHLFAIGTDITETRKAEAKIKAHNEEMMTLNKQMAEYKMMALRSAMNPHFLFNCLNSIQYFIAGNDKRSAISYLSLFAKLIRNVLNSSVNQYTTLEKEIETLKYYIELERLRFDDKFDFILSLDEDLDAGEIKIPSLIIQPYIENAIIHGLTGKDEQGTLLLEIKSQNDKLLCVVEDNGIGRQKSKSFNMNKKLAHKSVGMSVTEERLNIINKTNDVSVNIIDLETDGKASGTRVEILINIDKR